MHHILMINGLDAPLRKQFGCDCARCFSPGQQANTSASLITLNDTGETIHHVLFDIGGGVIDSLVENPYLRGKKARLDWLALTHWHPDHVIELNRLAVSHYLRQRPIHPIPAWCRRGTANWLQVEHGFEWNTHFEHHIPDESLPPGRVLPPIPLTLPNLTITPFTVSHLRADIATDRTTKANSCACFLIEHNQSKIVLMWDIDSENYWLTDPQSPEEKATVARLQNADTLFIDTAVWHVTRRPTSHPGFNRVHDIARSLQPQATYLMHLSGHPDGEGNPGWGWTNERWRKEAQKVWQEKELPGRVDVPHINQQFPL